MGLFDFLKKRKVSKPKEYDLPPLPPVDETTVHVAQEENHFDLRSMESHPEEEHELVPAEPVLKEPSTQPPPKAPIEEVKKRFMPEEGKKKVEHPLEIHPENIEKVPAHPHDVPPQELPEFPFSRPQIQMAKMTKEQLKPKRHVPNKPIFVTIHQYQHVLGNIAGSQNDIIQATDGLDRIDLIRKEQDSSLSVWKSAMEDMQRKCLFVDKTLFERKHA